MFDVGFSELLIIAVVALLVLGPERLPKAARFAGLWVRRARAQWYSVKSEFEREMAADELRRSLAEPAAQLRDQLAQAGKDVRTRVAEVDREVRSAVGDPARDARDARDAAADADSAVWPVAGAASDTVDTPGPADAPDGTAEAGADRAESTDPALPPADAAARSADPAQAPLDFDGVHMPPRRGPPPR